MEEKERRDVEEKKANNAKQTENCHGRSDYLMPEATWHVM